MKVDPVALAERLRRHPSVRGKLAIGRATEQLGIGFASTGQPGDDAAILPREGGYDLLAGEGFIPAFVANDPWFAGWCGIMVNLSDIAAMGGRSVALIDQIWAPSAEAAAPLAAGMKAAAESYGVPIVGGHTNYGSPDLGLALTVFGRAKALITSFDASPGDVLVAAIDQRGAYRNYDNFCAALDAPSERLRGDLELLPTLAEAGLVSAGKDISQSGVVGTALMLAECSGVGTDIALDAIAPPEGIALERWLVSFPSFGFLLSVPPAHVEAVCDRFAERSIWAAPIGAVDASSAVTLSFGKRSGLFWNHGTEAYLRSANKEPAYA